MEEYVWLIRRVDRFDGAGALVASLAFHSLLFIVLFSTSASLPVTGDVASFKVLWLSASSVPAETPTGDSKAPGWRQDRPLTDHDDVGQTGAAADPGEPARLPNLISAAQTGAEPTAGEAVEEKNPEDLPMDQVALSRHEPAPPVRISAPASAVSVTKQRPHQPASRAAENATPTKSADQRPHPNPLPEGEGTPQQKIEPQRLRQEAAPLAAALAPVEPPAAVKRVVASREEVAKRLEGPERVQARAQVRQVPSLKAVMQAAGKSDEEKVLKKPRSEPVQPKTLPVETVQVQAKPTASRAEASSVRSGAPIKTAPAVRALPAKVPERSTVKMAAVQQPADQERPAARPDLKAATASAEPKGLVIPSLRGDLKLIVAGEGGIKITFLFRDYPKSRRNRLPTRAEARRTQKLTPIIVKTAEQSREAVVETSAEGVYILIAETEQGHPAEANFSLELSDANGKRRLTPLGRKSVSGKTVIAKVLMREAILWEDEAAFTGSMMDAGSTTKFNAATGLTWKEYHD